MEGKDKTHIQYYSHSFIGFGNARGIVANKHFESKSRELKKENEIPEYAVAYNFYDIRDGELSNFSRTYVFGNEVSVDSIPDDFYNNTKMVKENYKSKGIEKLIHLRTDHYETHHALDSHFEKNWELVNCNIKK